MKVKRAGVMIAVMALIITLYGGASLADKSAATVEVPGQVTKGTEITVKIHVVHSGNNIFHYTNWVKVTANGKNMASWEYSAFNLPEGAEFTREFKLTINEPTEIIAEANCNLHGSQGLAKKMITLQP